MGIDIVVQCDPLKLFNRFSTPEAKAELEKTFRRRAKDANFQIARKLQIVAPTSAEIEEDVERHSQKKGFIIRPSAMEKARTMWNAKSKTGKQSKVVPIATRSEIARIENQIERLTDEINALSTQAKEYRRKYNKLEAQQRRLRTYNMRSAVKYPLADYKMLVIKRTEVQINDKQQTLKRIRTRLKISKTGIYPKASNKPNTTISGQLVTLHDLAVICEKQARIGAIRGTRWLFRMAEIDLGKRKLLSNRWVKTDHVSTRGETGYSFNVTDRGYCCVYTSPAFGKDEGTIQHVTSDRWEERRNRIAIESGFSESEKELVERVTESLIKLANS